MTTDHQTADTFSLTTAPADSWLSGVTFQSAAAAGEKVRLTWLDEDGLVSMTPNPDHLSVTYSEAEPGVQVVTVVVAGVDDAGNTLSSFAVLGLAAPEFRVQLEDALTLARLARSRRGEA